MTGPTVPGTVAPPPTGPGSREELRAVIVMGVSGVGKTAVGQALARRLGWEFVDADDLHGEANRRKMASGMPLDDDDRWPWLARVRALLDQRSGAGLGTVLACSALKEEYRQRLGVGRPGQALVHLEGRPELIAARLRRRRGHYMPPSLLQSQLATLEPPADAIRISVDQDVPAVVEEAVAMLLRSGAAAAGTSAASERRDGR